jgi:hypothetical protein
MALGEQSANAGGLPLWPAKLLIPLGFALLLLQALAEICKRIAILGGALEEPPSGGHPAQALPDAALDLESAAHRVPPPQASRGQRRGS